MLDFEAASISSLREYQKRPQHVSVGSKSHKRVCFGSCSGGNFSITVQRILNAFSVLEGVIEGLHLFLHNLLDIFAP